MEWSAIGAYWAQCRARLRLRWGRFNADHLQVIEARRQLLLGQLQCEQGLTPDQAEQQVAAWERGKVPPDDTRLRGAG